MPTPPAWYALAKATLRREQVRRPNPLWLPDLGEDPTPEQVEDFKRVWERWETTRRPNG